MQLEEFYQSSGQFNDNFLLGVGAPDPCETTATQRVILDAHLVRRMFSVTWWYTSVGIQ
jgi:hypothetical protein